MDLAELLNEYIRSELIVVIPVLYFLGRILRRSKVLCKRIPGILLVVSLAVTALYTFSVCDVSSLKNFYACLFSIVTQGVLLTGGSMFIHEMVKGRTQNKTDSDSKSDTDQEDCKTEE
ncbi:phage holin family protein [Massiliimalia timonensis]|uniref:phage holin family protein n=1 Tax=Massiliimalia timonensis TaxID=1987501 RepID=UPI00189F5955|nr:phage holin family protein [Massiliimalia timonensis]